MASIPQKFAAEFIGTFAVVFIAAGVICSAQYLVASGQPNFGLLGYALAYGLAYAVVMAAVGHLSGGHLNPAVTIGFWVTRRMGTLQCIGYWIAQILGALSAAYLLVAIVPDTSWGLKALGLITPDLSPDFTRGEGIVLEAFLTFLVVFVFFATTVDAKSALGKVAGFAVGITVTVDVLFGGPFTGASLNPARSFGPALATHHWQNHGVYWVGPLLGGIFGAVVYDRIFLRQQPPT